MIYNDLGEIQQKLIDPKDEPNFGGTLQTIKLVDERNSFSELDEIEFPRMIQVQIKFECKAIYLELKNGYIQTFILYTLYAYFRLG